MPKARLYGRYLTYACGLETLSLAIHDSMCGFRLYPLDETCAEIARRAAARMDFDTEIVSAPVLATACRCVTCPPA